MVIWQSKLAKYSLAIWLCHIARSSLAILRQPIAKQAMAIWRSPIPKKSESDLGNILSLNLCWRLGEEQSLSDSRAFTTIATQAMPFGDHLSLKGESDFSNILSLNMLATWR
jgi:hypothetical protein